jgi:cbb3-type cytochrome oxidase cytochrome c subunit
MNRFGTLAMVVVSGLVLAYVASEGLSFWKSLSYQPSVKNGSTESTDYPGLAPQEIGEVVLKTQGCRACHNLDLQGGVLAPSLHNVAARRSADWLREKLIDPQASVPGTYMPSFAHLRGEEIDGLVAFLGTLTPQRPGPDRTGTASIEIPTDAQGQPRFTPAEVERGKELFQSQGCIGCHTINGIAAGGQIGPNLTHEALRLRTDEWQLRHLINPVSVYVLGEPEGISWIMPSYRQLSEEDLKALVAFLQSLK